MVVSLKLNPKLSTSSHDITADSPNPKLIPNPKLYYLASQKTLYLGNPLGDNPPSNGYDEEPGFRAQGLGILRANYIHIQGSYCRGGEIDQSNPAISRVL